MTEMMGQTGSSAAPGSADRNETAPKEGKVSGMHGSAVVRNIRPPRGWGLPDFGEIWEYRELLVLLAIRDIRVRYKQTVLGIGWALIQPLMTVLIFTLLFDRIAKIPSEGVPYPIFALAAMVPWGFFSGSAAKASASIVGGASLIKKVYFPRLIVPLECVLAGSVDFLVTLGLLGGFMIYYEVPLSWRVMILPFLILLVSAAAFGVGLLLAAVNVRYRDVRQVVPFLFQFWMLATPIAYPASVLPPPLDRLYVLNPMAGVVEGFRWALLGTGELSMQVLGSSCIVTLVVLIAGVMLFQRMERSFVDVV